MDFKKITDLDIHNKILFIRVDMNVPIHDNMITDATRIMASLPTIKYAMSKGAQVIVATHLGRPLEGGCKLTDSVDLIANKLSQLLGIKVPVIKDLSTPINFGQSSLVMLENVRCNIGEKANATQLGKKYAALCDIFVHDAFATAHRAEASTDAIGYYVQEVCAGLLMSAELDALNKAFAKPKHPITAIVAGSKVSTKLSILENLSRKVDYLIVGGGILNTFLAATGVNVQKSLYEESLIPQAKKILTEMQERGAVVPLPHKVIVAHELSFNTIATKKSVDTLDTQDMILDIATEFANDLAQIIAKSATIIWNGPVGVFEFDQFANGTRIIANAVANSPAFSLAGGGDTIAAINKFGVFDKISYVSTAGGALLELLEGKSLPAIKLLEQR
ncbi:MAG: phosphoglycerate kinase [Proteobacteria bacterium]|jgi:phosphoglycerate kinase|nr:phosphoglycerate kinase [Pseudomonadota bacterium]